MPQFMPFPGYNPGSETTEHEQLPCAGYIGRIENARIEENPNSKSLCLTLDVAEGRYAGWFRNDYERRKGGMYPARHRGQFRLFYPKGNGSEQDGWTIDKFNRSISAIHKSNPGFEWDGIEGKLIGKYVGFITREAEWNGHVYIEIGKLVSVDAIRMNNYKMMPRRLQRQQNLQPAAPAPSVPDVPPGFTIVDPGNDLPF